jgi:hypothetical protein
MKPNSTYKRIGISVLFLLLNSFCLRAQNLQTLGPFSTATGHISLTDSSSWSAANNPSNLVNTRGFSVAGSVSKPYGINELKGCELAGIFRTHRYNIGTWMKYQGYTVQHSLTYGLSAGHKLTSKTGLGILYFINYQNVKEHFQAIYQSEIRLFTTSHLTRQTSIFTQINLPQPRDGLWILTGALGLSQKLSDEARLFSQFNFQANAQIHMAIGFEFRVHPKLILYTGLATLPKSISFGFRVNLPKAASISTSFGRHHNLGLSPNLGIEKLFKKKE